MFWWMLHLRPLNNPDVADTLKNTDSSCEREDSARSHRASISKEGGYVPPRRGALAPECIEKVILSCTARLGLQPRIKFKSGRTDGTPNAAVSSSARVSRRQPIVHQAKQTPYLKLALLQGPLQAARVLWSSRILLYCLPHTSILM